MRREPIIKRDAFWADVANLACLRQLHRPPFPSCVVCGALLIPTWTCGSCETPAPRDDTAGERADAAARKAVDASLRRMGEIPADMTDETPAPRDDTTDERVEKLCPSSDWQQCSGEHCDCPLVPPAVAAEVYRLRAEVHRLTPTPGQWKWWPADANRDAS